MYVCAGTEADIADPQFDAAQAACMHMHACMRVRTSIQRNMKDREGGWVRHREKRERKGSKALQNVSPN